MSTLEQVQALLPAMTYHEKLSLLGHLNEEVHPGIEKTTDVCGGGVCIAGTRIPVWALVGYRQLGASDAKLLEMYPTISAEDLAHAWTYYQFHEDDIDQQIADNEMDE